jgi:hypothetical protein
MPVPIATGLRRATSEIMQWVKGKGFVRLVANADPNGHLTSPRGSAPHP